MPVTLRVNTAEFAEALRQLPKDLADEARAIVKHAADEAQATVVSQYKPSAASIARAWRQKEWDSRFGTKVQLINTNSLAALYEYGTELRHTSQGWSRGRMPASHTFIRAVVDERAGMFDDLTALLERAGFRVSGR